MINGMVVPHTMIAYHLNMVGTIYTRGKRADRHASG